ncbi:unnamed protein product [Calicophoron daubneyi]|uniref:Rho-GAP domain-containing protein n=1 Tax=Calicophoron daubneyi TaxID=300641 RepID=A0AAV2TQL2_CALDB
MSDPPTGQATDSPKQNAIKHSEEEIPEVSLRLVRKQAYRVAGETMMDSASAAAIRSSDDTARLPSGTCTGSPTPQISFKPRHIPQTRGLQCTDETHKVQLGAVASLAIDGGLSPEQLLHIGCSSLNSDVNTSSNEPLVNTTDEPSQCSSYLGENKYPLGCQTATRGGQNPRGGRVHPQRFSRPVHPSPVHYSTTQPIYLSRTAQGACDRSAAVNMQARCSQRSHLKVLSSSAPRGVGSAGHTVWYSSGPANNIGASRRGSFPLQMTRVGGLVLNPAVCSSSEVTDCSTTEKLKDKSGAAYQSLSACTSPTSVEHTGTSSAPMAVFFSAAESPANTPPLSVTTTPPTNCTDIVRLGPGDTVTRAVPGDSNCTASTLIRMHCSPQPYVSMGPVDDAALHLDPNLIPSSMFPLFSPADELSAVTTCPMISCTTHTSSLCVPPLSPQAVCSPILSTVVGTELRHSSAESYTVCSTVSQSPPRHLSQYTARHTGASTSPGPQVARTVRHLRRIRHIFGDSLAYVSSGTSASMGTLTVAQKESTSTKSMTELRSHDSRSVDSVRPSSLVCKCPPEFLICPPGGLYGASDLDEASNAIGHTTAPVRFEHSSDGSPAELSRWENYNLAVSGEILIMTHVVSDRSFSAERNHIPAHLNHLHLSLTGDALCWRPALELSDGELPPAALLKEPVKSDDAVVAILNNSSQRIQCQMFLRDSATARELFGQLVPAGVLHGATTTHTTKADSCSHTSEPATNSSHHSVRSKQVSGRSSSLGVAGPPGAIPLFRAMGTAAASVGMPLVGRSSLTSWLHPGSNRSHEVGISISAPIPIDPINGSLKKFKEVSAPVSGQTSGSTSDHPESKTPSKHQQQQSRPRRGRLHQAFTRMRRAATASSDPSARSNSASNTRRFASSHGALASSKSSVDTTPCTSSPPGTDIDEQLSHIEPESSSSTCLQMISADILPRGASPVRLAASISPSPALQSPCLMCLPIETMGPPSDLLAVDTTTTDSRSSGTDYSPFPAQSLSEQSVGSSREVAEEEFEALKTPTGLHIQSTPSDRGPSLGEDGLQNSSFKRLHETQPSFVPLPLPSTGPLPLHKCPRSTLSPFVPFIVELCVTLVERYGLNCVGLYRLSGSKLAHDFMTTELRKHLSEIDVTSDKWNDIHAVCGVLKTFLRNLPDSLFPKVMYPDFLAACRLPQRERRLLSIQRLLGIMECYPHHPEYRAHRATLRYLATHLARVSARETVNKMTTYNLALVFAPNLVQPCEDSPELLMSDSKYKIMLVDMVIKYHAWIFSPDLGLESACSIPSDSVEDLTSAGAPSELDLTNRSAVTESGTGPEPEDPITVPGRVEGDVQPLVAELLNAAANLPPPPSDTDLETAEEPGPSSDRPSDIASIPMQRPRFTSIPTNAWSAAALRSLDTEHPDAMRFRPELVFTQETDVDSPGDQEECAVGADQTVITTAIGKTVAVTSGTNASSGFIPRPRPFNAQLGTKLDSLRHLSQGCLDQYTSEARQLNVRVAESRRQLQSTVAQRLHAEQLLLEARGENPDQTVSPPSSHGANVPEHTSSLAILSEKDSPSKASAVTEQHSSTSDSKVDRAHKSTAERP